MNRNYLKEYLNSRGFKRITIKEVLDGVDHHMFIRVRKIPLLSFRLAFQPAKVPRSIYVHWSKLKWWENWLKPFKLIERFDQFPPFHVNSQRTTNITERPDK